MRLRFLSMKGNNDQKDRGVTWNLQKIMHKTLDRDKASFQMDSIKNLPYFWDS